MFLSKVTVTLSCVITENNLYLNLLVPNLMLFFSFNLSFTCSLNVFYLEMDG